MKIETKRGLDLRVSQGPSSVRYTLVLSVVPGSMQPVRLALLPILVYAEISQITHVSRFQNPVTIIKQEERLRAIHQNVYAAGLQVGSKMYPAASNIAMSHV